MRRDFETFASRRYDVLVVGGGIHGLFAAYEAAGRGLSVGLVESSDFGGGVTFNHQRTLHGGLRALQSGNLLKAGRQIRERRTWAIIAPHLVRPLPFLIGTYRRPKRSRMALRAGLAIYDVLGRRRNARVEPELHLPRTRLESRAATRALFPGISEDGLTGGAVWYDYQTCYPERLTWCVALGAAGYGARLLNYAEAVGPLRENGRVRGCTVRDAVSGRSADVVADCTVLAPGSRLSALHAQWGLGDAPPVLRALNALVDRPARDIALAGASASGRMLTAVPWSGCVLVGTHQSAGPVDASETGPPGGCVEELLAEANSAFPTLGLAPRDVRLVHYGLTPAVVRSGRAELMPDHRVLRHSRRGVRGVISIVGVKYTTARLAAAEAVDTALADLSRKANPSRSATDQLPHAGITDAEGRVLEQARDLGVELDSGVVAHLTGWYGDEAASVVAHGAESVGLERLTAGTPVLACEVTYAAEHAAVTRLADVVLRRTALSQAGRPEPGAVERAADLLTSHFGWTEDRRRRELSAVEAAFPKPDATEA